MPSLLLRDADGHLGYCSGWKKAERAMKLYIAVAAVIGWAIGLIMGGLGAGNFWAPRLEQAEAEHIACSQLLVDEQAKSPLLQCNQLREDLEEAYRNIDLLEGQYLNALEAAMPVDNQEPDPCEPFSFEEYATIIYENADMASVVLHHMNQARNIVNLCLPYDFEQWLPEVHLHINEAIHAQAMLHSWLSQENGDE